MGIKPSSLPACARMDSAERRLQRSSSWVNAATLSGMDRSRRASAAGIHYDTESPRLYVQVHRTRPEPCRREPQRADSPQERASRDDVRVRAGVLRRTVQFLPFPASIMSSPAPTTATSSLAGKYLTVVLDNEAYGIAVLKVREIIRMQK